jgi:bacterioferritin-associated ferredoxin
MVVCSCKAVSDVEIREAVAGGAQTVGQVRRACGASSCCGGCRPLVAEIMEEELVALERKVLSFRDAPAAEQPLAESTRVALAAQQG